MAALSPAVFLAGAALAAATAAPGRPVAPRGPLHPDEASVVALFERAQPSVVYIRTLVLVQDAFTMNVTAMPAGTGSGFVWDERGHIVTNFHVLQGAERAQVILADQSVLEARLVGTAPDKDLAVLRVDAPPGKLVPIPVGSSEELKAGQSVYAIGNPFGLDQSLTTGVISALGREIESVSRRPIQDVIQTDAAINPGNSGGPLLDSAGRLIGVNTMIFSPSGAYAGVGFAVPADTVNRIVPQLILYGRDVRPGFGVGVAQDGLARRLGVQGVLVLDVSKGSAGARAGLRGTSRDRRGRLSLGDVIVAVDGERVRDSKDLYRILDRRAVGDKVELEVVRDGGRLRLKSSLQALE